jgi:hypothetical protein
MDNRRLDSKRYRKYQVRSDMRMGKIFLKPPSNRIDKIFFSISLVRAISGKPIDKEEILQMLKYEGIELDNELKNKLMGHFPELQL